jgi:DNA polymerase III epsilon subunit-like protein
MAESLIIDFETLSQNPINGALVSCALLTFEMDTLLVNGYTYEELLSKVEYFKFEVKSQVTNWNRKIDPKTLEWWKQQSKDALDSIKPSEEDKQLTEFIPWMVSHFNRNKLDYIFSRNNTFDPVIVQSICSDLNLPLPYDWWKIRDTKSFIMGLTYTAGIKDNFIPAEAEHKYVEHDPRHDVVLDVMRMQTLLFYKFGEQNVS